MDFLYFVLLDCIFLILSRDNKLGPNKTPRSGGGGGGDSGGGDRSSSGGCATRCKKHGQSAHDVFGARGCGETPHGKTAVAAVAWPCRHKLVMVHGPSYPRTTSGRPELRLTLERDSCYKKRYGPAVCRATYRVQSEARLRLGQHS